MLHLQPQTDSVHFAERGRQKEDFLAAATRAAFLASTSLLVLNAPAFAQTVSVGTGYYSNTQTAGSGSNGSNATWDGGKPGDGGTGDTGTSISATVSYGNASGSTYDGTLIVASTTGGTGGTGGNGETYYNGRGGGSGGAGGNVTLSTNSLSGSYYFDYSGIYAYSQGGKGGQGGGTDSFSYNGGNGGSGGTGGTVTLNVYMPISATGTNAYGIWAQSLGGQGGNGGNEDNITSSGNGGEAGAGGAGGTVLVTTTSRISSSSASAIFAQSIGGNGGSGGSTDGWFGGESGGGGYGGNGGAIGINSSGQLVTTAQGGWGIYAQSIGGGGGNAGIAAGIVALGGSGGPASQSGEVYVSNSGAIQSAAAGSAGGIFAQSVGGAGGGGGMAFSSGTLAASIGGSGGDGGAGYLVEVINTGTICTGNCSGTSAPTSSAGGAFGIFAQSVGGGGGAGGFGLSGSASLIAGASFALGGSGGGGGAGGEVYVSNTASISTVETNSAGILAQSVGGGGGNAGGAVSFNTTDGLAAAVSHGGSGGSGGAGGFVATNCVQKTDVYEAGAFACNALAPTGRYGDSLISTQGEGSPGIAAQSIGGGGGSGGYAVALSGSTGGSFSFAIGGSGGSGGAGGGVFAGTNGVQIETVGDDSPGLIGQSVGGGGGSGGAAISTSLSSGVTLGVSLGGTGGSGGAGYGVEGLNAGGVITTFGDRSYGMLLQSVGGGGGAGGATVVVDAGEMPNFSLSVGGQGGSGGAAAGVFAFNTGDILQTEAGAALASQLQAIPPTAIDAIKQTIKNYKLVQPQVYTTSDAMVSSSTEVETTSTTQATASVSQSGLSSGSSAITTYGLGSSAIVAQSIGGGGGTGGFSVSGDAVSLANVAVSIGGTGGSGNTGGNVFVLNFGQLSTYGGGAPVLLAQSVGGGGGAGGFGVTGDISGELSESWGVGGGGGTGAASGSVVVVNAGAILSSASSTGNAAGLVAQSIGGSGGNGAFSATGSYANGNLAVAVGGGGGAGGTAGAVEVWNDGVIQTVGPLSAGLMAQSLGGNGGTGGFTVGAGAGSETSLGLSVGGGGGSGGTASGVDVTTTSIQTTGDQSPGVVAQAIGGAGGSGGWDIAGTLGSDMSASLSIGSSGGAGGQVTGAVSVASTGTISTSGLLSYGILAQSIGGNGGNAGISASAAGAMDVSTTFALGGGGGAGGQAGAVEVTASGTITTTAAQSAGILAQSIGGGGGSGGSAFAGAFATGASDEVSLGDAAAMGGTGGTGQDAGTVAVTAASIYTVGQMSAGVVAQSIGGAGGYGGNSRSQSLSGVRPQDTEMKLEGYSASVSLGGSGASGGTGGTASVLVVGTIQTGSAPTGTTAVLSDLAPAIVAQSIGGSGGNGGSATTASTASEMSFSVAVGGGGSTGGDAGQVEVSANNDTTSNSLITYGSQSPALLAQSIGGGGGNGGASVAYSQYAKYGNAFTATVAVGGSGAGGGTGGVVGVASGGSILTFGSYSPGIFAQSVGGGGGNGGAATTGSSSLLTGPAAEAIFAATGEGAAAAQATADFEYLAGNYLGSVATIGNTKSKNSSAISLTIGGDAGTGGSGGTVQIASSSLIGTASQSSPGIFAQSVGGGGGNGGSGDNSSGGKTYGAAVTLGGWGGDGGDGGAVSVSSTGNIQTLGTQSFGIFAQSVGGGGGNGGSVTSSVKGGASGYKGEEDDDLLTGTRAVLAFGLGGAGGSGGTGGAVSVTAGSDAAISYINALGASAPGLFAQSVGGGGGNGGSSHVSTAMPIKVKLSAEESTAYTALGLNFLGHLSGVSSETGVGADGKKGSTSFTDILGLGIGMSFGGSGGSGGAGGDVSVSNKAVIVTGLSLTTATSLNGETPDYSPAIAAQSVGGGGGNGGATHYRSSFNQSSVSLSLGGDGGSASDGGMVGVTTQGTLVTMGASSPAIFAQSVGGGGGNGGNSSTTYGAFGTGSLAVGMGGSGTGGGSGGAVAVSVSSGVDAYGITPGIWTSGAQSFGILAQSVGGGGGSAGSFTGSDTSVVDTIIGEGGSSSALTTGSAAITDSGMAIALAQGSAGDGGNGGTVTVNSATPITTSGAQSAGILAQSVGGGGGVGGSGFTNTANATYLLSFAQGTSAASEGAGGAVSLTQSAAVTTSGNLSFGLAGQSIGGGGGLSSDVSSTTAASGTILIGMSLGDSGGSSLNAGQVTLTASGTVATSGSGSTAILAQSIGGGGGIAASYYESGGYTGATAKSVSLGATGGSGGDGAAVAAVVAQSVSTTGSGAMGLLLQSVGAGGGLAASNTYASSSEEMQGARSAIAMGAASSASGNGGPVNLTFGAASEATSIITTGVNAHGVVAQSIAGGGGVAVIRNGAANGNTAATQTISLKGMGGGTSGVVGVSLGSATTISTSGFGAAGVVAQSITGGGGVASINDTLSSLSASAVPYTSTLAFGSTGGDGDNSGATTVSSAANIATESFTAPALLAQSIAGGGGFGVNEVALTGTISNLSITSDLGGSGGLSGSAGSVSLSSSGTVQTAAKGALGVVAQSIAGGGGVGLVAIAGSGSNPTVDGKETLRLGATGGSSGSAGAVTTTLSGSVSTGANRAPAVISQSIAGGGGILGTAFDVETTSLSSSGSQLLGGSAGGSAGAVTTTSSASIFTSGDLSAGLMAQSIGGGGGLSISREATTLGGSGGGSGGAVTVTSTGAITTTNDTSIGIIAQSIGGGGGVAAAASSARLGATGGSGDGGTVQVTSSGAISTSGENAVGILAQSIGGGGGVALGTGNSITGTLNSGGTGTGGAVTVTVNAPITVRGAGSDGVIAQSVSNGGGLVMNGTSMTLLNGSTGSSGKVTVNANASITASGSGGKAINAQGNGDPIVNVAEGVAITGGLGGRAIVSDGSETYVNNRGSLSTLDGAEGLAIETFTGFAEVTNWGSVMGNLALTPGAANQVVNLTSGTLWAGSSLDLGGTGHLINAGTLRSGSTALGATRINGSLTQTPTGIIAVRADQITGLSDTFHVTGNAHLAGGVLGIIYNPALARPGQFDTPFLTADGTLTTDNLVAYGDTAILDFSLSTLGGGLSLGTSIDFTPFGLSAHHQVIGTLIGEIQTRGSSPVFQLIVPQLLQVTTVAGLDSAYESVGGGAVSMVPTTMMNAASAAFAGITTQMDLWRTGLRSPSTALSYAGVSPSAAARASTSEDMIGSGRYFWAAPMASLTTGGGLSGTMAGASIGLDGELPGVPALLGAAANFSTSQMQEDGTSAQAATSFGSFSLYGVYQAGPAYVSAIAMAGYGNSNFDRNLYNLNLNLATSSGLDGWLLGGRIEAGYGFALGASGATLTPFAAFQPMGLRLGSDTESFGPLGAGLTYGGNTITALPLYLGVQLDGIWTAGDGRAYAPFLRAAWMHDFSPSRDVIRSFAELPGFTFSGTDIPNVADALDLHAGIRFQAGPGLTLSAGLDAQLGGGYSTLGATGALRVTW